MGAVTWGGLAELATALAAAAPVVPDPVPAPAPAAAPTVRGDLASLVSTSQLLRVTRRLALQIPAVRAGHAKITKTPGTWPLRLWQGDAYASAQPTWCAAPDPRITFGQLVAETLDDAVWFDRAYWRVTYRGRDGYPLRFERVPVDRVTDDAFGIRVDGRPPSEVWPSMPGPVVLSDGRILESVIPFRWCGLGGLNGAGSLVMDNALQLLSAATNMARSPMPQALLTPDGPTGQLSDQEIDDLLAAWEEKRRAHATAYLQGVKLDSVGFSAKDLQLVEAREHSALEVARALALPAAAVDASSGASLTYSTTVENRRDLVEALRLWAAPLEQGLSLHAAPRGVDVRFDVTSFLRDDPQTRMNTWATALACGALTLEEVRAAEPLATGPTPPPAPPTAPGGAA